MKNTQKGYVVPALLGIIALLIIAFIVYIYNDKKSGSPAQETETAQTQSEASGQNTQNPTVTTTGEIPNATSSDALPNIAILNPSSVPLLSSFKINGTKFDAVGGEGNGWLNSSHIFVKITNSGGQTGILWEGGSQGGKASSPNQIEVGAIPKTICTISEVGTGGCPDNKKMEVALGKYNLYVTVDGRGTSNTVPLTVINGVQ